MKQQMDEMKQKMIHLKEQKNKLASYHVIKDEDIDYDHLNKLQMMAPSFRRVVNSLIEESEKCAAVQTNCDVKVIDVHEKQVATGLQTFENISNFYKSIQSLKNSGHKMSSTLNAS